MKSGFIFIISGPSAVGKSSIVDEILRIKKISLQKIVTYTTRAIRHNEIDGIDYNFMNMDAFLYHQSRGDFIESSEIYGNYYGIMLSTISEEIDKGNNLLVVINWEGYLKIKKIFNKNVFGFFITPPSFQDLENRIRTRSTDSEDTIKHRLEMANEDMQYQHEFDFCFENIKISETANKILQKIYEITSR